MTEAATRAEGNVLVFQYICKKKKKKSKKKQIWVIEAAGKICVDLIKLFWLKTSQFL